MNTITLTADYKERVLKALLEVRKNYTVSDAVFAKQYGINNTVFSRLRKGSTDGLLREAQWMSIGRQLGVNFDEKKWNLVRTEVFNQIEEEISFCKQYSKARIFVDDCGIGKTFTGQYLSRTLENCFYIDASQAKTKSNFIRLLAKTIGVDTTGKITEIKENLKYLINALPQPIIIIDEAGDLDYSAFLTIKELWNATEDRCGWYMMGAEGLQAKIDKGINGRKVGYREIFSRFSEKYSSVVPLERGDRTRFYKKLIGDVINANLTDKSQLNKIVAKSLVTVDGNIGGLRRAHSLMLLNN